MLWVELTRWLVIAGYLTVVIWCAFILWRNHMNPIRRQFAVVAGAAASGWVLFYLWFTVTHPEADWAILLSRLAHAPVIATLLIVTQSVDYFTRRGEQR